MTYVVTGNSINITINGKVEVLHKNHENYDEIVALLKSGNEDENKIKELINPAEKIREFGSGLLSIKDGKVFYSKDEDVEVKVDDSLIDRIYSMAQEGFSVDPLVKFFENLMENTSSRAVNGLYKFLENNKLPLTDDGHFLAYKKVRHDYLDVHSKTFDNSVGRVVEMLRNQVDENYNNTCSRGLHFASFDYASNFYSTWDKDDRLMLVKVNPADVVAFPNDYNNAKGRACRYEVISEVPNNGLEYMLDYIQGVNTVDDIRDLIESVRKVVVSHTPVVDDKPSIDWTISVKFIEAGLHKVHAQAIVDELRETMGIETHFDVERASIYNLVKFISEEIDLSEKYNSED